MLEKYENYKKELEKLNAELNKPEVLHDHKKLKKISKKQSQVKEIVDAFEELKEDKKRLKESREIAEKEEDEEMKKMAEEETEKLKREIAKKEKNLQILLIPKDPSEDKNAILEIRAGTGGEEAALFARDLFRMYSRFAEKKGWKTEILSSNKTGIEGFKEIIAKISGEKVYKHLKYESGVHRVQRVPETESSGRIHTSATTVAVMPEAEEIDIKIDPRDLKIDVFRSSGPGGQSVNTTDSAVRITYIPTGMTVSCQDEKSQIKNRTKALSILRARLFAQKQEEERKKRGEMRKSQIGSGDRSEKIRTYNFPQDRITDHRINYTSHNLEKILDGNIEELTSSLIEAEQKELLKNT